jgi:Flp pilus assembly pilin Flp
MDAINSRSLLAAGAADEGGQATTEYAAVIAVLLLALGGVIFALEPAIQTFIQTVGDKVAAIIP